MLDGKKVDRTPLGVMQRTRMVVRKSTTAEKFFGVPLGIEDGFAVVVDGCLSPWNEMGG